jgi:hypothetical protein
MIRVLVGALLSAVVLMGWGFVFWEVLPVHDYTLKKLTDEQAVVVDLKKGNPESGHYFIPFPDKVALSGKDPTATESLTKRRREGPLVEIIYRKEGVEGLMDPMIFVQGFIHFLVSALIAGLLLTMALPNLPTYLGRVLFVFLLGLFASVVVTLSDPIWFLHPWQFALLKGAFEAAGWLLAGLVLGLVVRPRTA